MTKEELLEEKENLLIRLVEIDEEIEIISEEDIIKRSDNNLYLGILFLILGSGLLLTGIFLNDIRYSTMGVLVLFGSMDMFNNERYWNLKKYIMRMKQ